MSLVPSPKNHDYRPSMLKRFLLTYIPLLLIMLAIANALYTTDQQARSRAFGQQELTSIT